MTEDQPERNHDSTLADYQAHPGDVTNLGGKLCQIHVLGQLDSSWSAWLEGFELKLLENGEMLLTGMVADQAALMGILNKLNRLNLPLISVNLVNATENR